MGRGNGIQGFTLIEMLMVIVILTVLAMLVLPVLARAMGTARGTVCANNLRQIGLGAASYSAEHRGRMMPAEFRDGEGTYPIGSWINYLYVEELGEQNQLFQCPEHLLSPDQTFDPYGGDGLYSQVTQASYIMNTITSTSAAWQGAELSSAKSKSFGFVGEKKSDSVRSAWLKHAAEKIYIVDRAPRLDYSGSWNNGNSNAARGINRYSETDYGVIGERPTTDYRKINYLHNDGFFALFGDSHIKRIDSPNPEAWVAYVR